MMAGHTLDTPRLHLRLMRQADFAALLQIFTDPQVMAAFDSPPFSEAQMQQWLQRNLDHQAQYGYGLFSVLLKRDGQLIGNCGLEHMTVDEALETELGYDFRSDVWNQGYATEAAGAVRDFALDTLHLPRLLSLIRTGNGASCRVAEKIGMSLHRQFTRHGITYLQYVLEKHPGA